ncbi:glycosyltransferase family 2 protein [cf. Phormidesmis sp. LEGE 11477]|uniref:glycosyltransferase n=1 Tax=cf. Phormidesmis sp. LEGE 11477 TaxID=1828680 RepID=UPI001D135D84|nr:glycosyltransferase family 2 protein [cf. Phormidesmis sp. LEGE 11477]
MIGSFKELIEALERWGITGWFDPWLGFWGLLFASCIANLDFHRRFQSSIRSAPRLDLLEDLPTKLPSVSVIIPAYNEEENIAGCMESVLANALPDGAQMRLIVADDESNDRTRTTADKIAKNDGRVKVLTVPPRPTDQPWRGKNWACVQAAKEVEDSEYILFIDADVRLNADAIACALTNAQTYNSDLLSCAPKLVCGCFSEWLVQPLMALLIAVGFSFEGVNDPKQQDKAAAAGPFMLFRAAAYKEIGGHAAVATIAVEDFELAKVIKASGFNLRYVLGTEAVSVRMYRSFAGLWEGWTKNFYTAGGRNPFLAVASSVAIALLFVVPWLGIVISLFGLALDAPAASIALVLSILAVTIQLFMRLAAARAIGEPHKYLYLGWLGGGLISAIAIVSMIKTETGWGWTWKGRSLATKASPMAGT